MKKNNRVFLIVLDSVGVGYLPDADSFGDEGADTMHTIASSNKFAIPNMKSFGLGNIEGLSYLGFNRFPQASFGKCIERSNGKDTTTGHWEIAGITSKEPFPTYPQGFPKNIIEKITEATKRGVLCNKPYSGTQVIHDYGVEHIKTGKYIIYTSADSVCQVAAHEAVIPVEELYSDCEKIRKIFTGKDAVGRIIARPFEGEYPNFVRTSRRHDISLVPPKDTILDMMVKNGYDTIGIGKIYDIFAGKGVSEKILINGNTDGMKKTSEVAKRDFNGLCFVNLVDFDMLYGHRNDIEGYAQALSEFDSWLPHFTDEMREEDILIITADHGCDPGYPTTDHTREYIPLLVYGKKLKHIDLGIRKSYADIASTIAQIFDIDYDCEANGFYDDIRES